MFGAYPWGSAPWTGNLSIDSSILASSNESASAADTSNRTPGMSRAQAEAAAAKHTQNATRPTDRSEPAAAVDAPSVLLMYAWRFQNEATTASDSEQVTMVVARSEPTPAVDSLSVASVAMAQSATEAGNATDAPNKNLSVSVTAVDTLTATDIEAAAMTAARSVAEQHGQQLAPGLYPQYSPSDLTSFSRPIPANYIDPSTGAFVQVGNNVPRVVGGALLIERASTNIVRGTLGTAAPGTPGTLPGFWSGTLGTVNGVNIRLSGGQSASQLAYIDFEVSGTATADFDSVFAMEQLNRQLTTIGDSWVASAYSRSASGTIPPGSINLVVGGRTSGGADSEFNYAPMNVANGVLGLQRTEVAFTVADPTTVSTGPQLAFTFTAGTFYLYTFRIGGIQQEPGTTATNFIISPSFANASRGADVALIGVLDSQSATAILGTTASDTGTPTETSNGQKVVLQTEPGNATDTESVAALQSQTDAASATDSATPATSSSVSRSDSVSPSDVASGLVAIFRTDNEPTTANDAPSVLLMYSSRSVDEPANATDNEVTLVIASKSASDSVTPTDQTNAGTVVPVFETDNGAATDTPTRSLDTVSYQTEQGNATDNINKTNASSASVSETGNAISTEVLFLQKDVSWFDLIGVTDQSNRALVTPVSETESGSATSTQGKTILANVQRAESTTPTHTQSADSYTSTGRTDNEQIVDKVTQQTSASASRNESSPAQDTNVGSNLANVERHDTGTVTDQQNSQANVQRQQTENNEAQDKPSAVPQAVGKESTSATDIYYKWMHAEVAVTESTTPTHTQNGASTFNRWLQEDTVAIDTSSVLALMQAIVVDQAMALDRPVVADFTVSVSANELANISDTANGMVAKLTQVLEGANAQDLQAAAVTMIRMVEEMNPALDVAAAVSHASVVVAEEADATDWCAIVIPVGTVEGTDATDTCAVFLYNTNRMLLLFDKDCHC